jgi:WD40 repeat protein
MHRALPASRLEQTFTGHTDRVYAISYSPDGRWLASASLDGTVKVWDMQSPTTPLSHDFRISPGDSEYGATSVTFSPDGRFLAAANAEGEIILWDAGTWQEIKRIEAHPQATIWTLAFSPASDLIASAGADAILKTWNTDLGLVAEFPAIHRDGIEALAFSPDGTRIATASLDGSAILWDLASTQNLFTFRIKANIITNPTQLMGVTFNLDGSRLITSASDSNIYVWDAINGTQENVMKISGHEDWVYGLLVRPGSDVDALEGEIISAGADRSINIWGARYGRLRLELRGHTDQVYAIAINPQDDGILASASADNTIRIWNIAWDGNYERFNVDLESPVYDQPGEWLPGYSEDIDFSPDGKVLAVSMAIAADPTALYPSYGKPGSVIFLDPATGKPIGNPLMGHTASVMAINFNNQGDRLVSASWDKTAIVWDLNLPEPAPLLTLQHDSQVYSASYSKDDRWIVTGQNNGTVTIWDAASGQMRNSFQPNSERRAIQQASFNADGSLVAVQSRGSADLLLLDALSGQVRMTLSGHDDIIRDFDFSPDGNYIVTVGDDAKIFIWDMNPDLNDDERLRPFDFSDHLATIYSVNFSGDGEKILSAGADGIIKVWQVSNPETEEETWRLAYSLYAYAFANDDTILDIELDPVYNEHVVALVNDWTVRGFTFNTDELIAMAEQKIQNRKVTCHEIEKYQLTNQYDCIP